jgi:nicotinamidase/pyrazinamidase
VVDPQNDFISGSLPVPGGEQVAHRLAELMTHPQNGYDHIVTTQDWHHDPGTHWADEPDYVDTWPRHGAAGSWGARLHPAVENLPVDERFYKGHYSPGYSGFEGITQGGKGLHDWLKEHGVNDIDVAGLATDKCVYNTAKDASKLGIHTRVLPHYSSPVTPEGGAVALDDLHNMGVEIVNGPQVPSADTTPSAAEQAPRRSGRQILRQSEQFGVPIL